MNPKEVYKELKELVVSNEEDRYIDGYVCVLQLNTNEPDNMHLDYAKVVKPIKVRCSLSNKTRNQGYYHNNVIQTNVWSSDESKVLKKEIKIDAQGKPGLHFFYDREDCTAMYRKELEKAFDIINKRIEVLNLFKQEITFLN